MKNELIDLTVRAFRIKDVAVLCSDTTRYHMRADIEDLISKMIFMTEEGSIDRDFVLRVWDIIRKDLETLDSKAADSK